MDNFLNPAALTATKEKELNWENVYPWRTATTERDIYNDKNSDEYFKAQQAHKTALQQISYEKQCKRQHKHHQQGTSSAATVARQKHGRQAKNDEVDEDTSESNENEKLLGGQQQVVKINAAAAGVQSKEMATTFSETSYDQAACTNQHPVQLVGCNQNLVDATTTNAADFASTRARALVKDIDLNTDCKLELHEFPKEMMQSENNINEQNGSTRIPAPALFTSNTHDRTDVYGGGGGGGGNVGGGLDIGAARGGGNGVGAANDGVYKGPKIWQYLVKNYSISSQPLAILIILLALWVLGSILMPGYAAPSTALMRLILLIVGAQMAGVFVSFLKVPDMLGMLFFGVLYTNLGLADFSGYQKLEAFLREMALINIMLLAGLGLDASAFKKLWFMILRLTFIPTAAEVAIITILAHFLLKMSWLWGILLGLVITAVSPNVVVTVMLKLKEDRLGLNSGIHTLIYAMTTCNDVLAIFLFGVCCGIIFSTGSLTEQILQGPIGIGIGIVFGYIYGLMLQFVPSRNANYVHGLRFVLTVLGGTIAVLGSKAISYPSAGALGCVTVAFVAGIGWKRQEKKLTTQQLQAYETSNVAKRLDLLWRFLKPVSFSLIGKEIHFAVLDGKVVGYGALLVLLGSAFRLAFAYLSTYGGNLTRRERGYITISGFPKATVQAALGPIALDLARSLNSDDANLSLASNVLIISVLAIIFTAPLGAILMLRLAPLWLKHSPLSSDNLAANDGRRNVDMTNFSANVTPNFTTIEAAGNNNFDRNQKTVL